MIIYPAIDLKDGKCVRLIKGDMEMATIFSENPAEQALLFQQAGFKWLHIVDLNGAFEGYSVNAKIIQDIINHSKLKIQLGGGIRSIENISAWLEAGINRVILGTIAVANPALVKEACKLFPGHIAVGIDARNGIVATAGWAESSNITTIDIARKYEDSGVSAIIYTDINRDGILSGIDLEGTLKLKQSVNIPIIASGGISNMADVEQVKSSGIDGVIIGRAIYDKKITLDELCQSSS